jgi:LysM repeat protein
MILRTFFLRAVLVAGGVTTGVGLLTAETPAGAARCSAGITVQKLDSWSLLADYAGIKMGELLKANGATVKTVIKPGQTLCLPAGATFSRPGDVAAQTKTAAATPKIVLPKKRYSVAEAEQIIRDVFPDKLERRALKIARRESKLNAVSYGWCCYGLFQIHFEAHKKWLGALGVTNPSQLLDAQVNVQAAWTLYQRSNSWAPWE